MTGHKGLVCWRWRFRCAWLLAQNHETASYWSQSHKYHLCYGANYSLVDLLCCYAAAYSQLYWTLVLVPVLGEKWCLVKLPPFLICSISSSRHYFHNTPTLPQNIQCPQQWELALPWRRWLKWPIRLTCSVSILVHKNQAVFTNRCNHKLLSSARHWRDQ